MVEINGIIILDKPTGITSHKAAERVKIKLSAQKSGHAGTLDPAVTGVLLVALNSSTKLMPLLNGLDKEYEGIAHLHQEVDEKKLVSVINQKFLGKITQLPPRKSSVARVEREREIYTFEILEIKNKDFKFRVKCQAGTYIRKLIFDLGQELGVGAHMKSLRRISQGPFIEKEAIKMDNLIKKDIVSNEKMIGRLKLPVIYVNEAGQEKLRKGQFLTPEEILKIKGKFGKDELTPLFYDKKVISLGRPFFNSNEIKKQEGYVLKPDRVI